MASGGASGGMQAGSAEQQEEGSLAVLDGDIELSTSPQLSRRTLDELGQLQEVADPADPENYPLHSPWTFWFER